jgi:hypothetical protein
MGVPLLHVAGKLLTCGVGQDFHNLMPKQPRKDTNAHLPENHHHPGRS